MKIIDCVSYLNEDDILNIRLKTLYDVVDKFVILEAKETHQGHKKELNFDIKKFEKYKNKICYHILDEIVIPKNFKPSKPCSIGHHRDQCQRNYIENCINEYSENDWILISDIDEIPNPNQIINYNLDKKKIGIFDMSLYYYRLNLKANIRWHGTKMCKKKHLKSAQWLREVSPKRGIIKTLFNIDNVLIKNGGWHFSYLMSPEDIAYKLKNFAHSEENTDEQTNIKNISNLIENRKDIFLNRNLKFSVDDIKSLPLCIQNNVEEYKKWLILDK